MNFLFYVPQMAEYGGMERHVCLLAMLLRGKGHAVTLLTTSNSLNPLTRAELQDAHIELKELPVGRGRASKALKLGWLLLNSLQSRLKHWDLIYTNGQSGLAKIVWMAAGKGTRIVHHHHTAGDEVEQKTWHPAFRRALAAAPELVACSRSTKAHLEATLQRADVTFLPYLTPELTFPEDTPLLRAKPNGTLHFGFAGRLVSTKGIDTICELSRDSELAGIQWHIHGKGDEFPAAYFAPYEKIEYHGPYTSAAEGARALDRLDAFALFSRHNEGMPLSLIEAMAAGLPWIATDRGGTRELAISANNCEVVPPEATLDEIKSRTLALASRIRAGMTSRGDQRRAYDENLSFETAARRWSDYFGVTTAA